jgi:hypothetical protein
VCFFFFFFLFLIRCHTLLSCRVVRAPHLAIDIDEQGTVMISSFAHEGFKTVLFFFVSFVFDCLFKKRRFLFLSMRMLAVLQTPFAFVVLSGLEEQKTTQVAISSGCVCAFATRWFDIST